MIITAHQPNFLPGKSVLDKIAASDAVIWLDECQYSHGGFTNRNRLPSGAWLTVPVAGGSAGAPINRVRIAQPRKDWRALMIAAIEREHDWTLYRDAICREISRPYRALTALNVALLRIAAFAMEISAPWHFQSHLDGGHAEMAVSDERAELAPISNRIAMMVGELGGTTYLSGPSGRHYLNETPFAERGILVEYWQHQGENPSALELVSRPVKAAA